MYKVWTTRIREEKNFKIKFQVIFVFYRTKCSHCVLMTSNLKICFPALYLSLHANIATCRTCPDAELAPVSPIIKDRPESIFMWGSRKFRQGVGVGPDNVFSSHQRISLRGVQIRLLLEGIRTSKDKETYSRLLFSRGSWPPVTLWIRPWYNTVN